MAENFDRPRPSKEILRDINSEEKLIIKDNQKIDPKEPLSPDEIEARLTAEEEMRKWIEQQRATKGLTEEE